MALDTEWMTRGSCTNEDPELFHPGGRKNCYNKAKAICDGCPVKGKCLDLAMQEMDEFGIGRHGMWGGTTVIQRLGMVGAR